MKNILKNKNVLITGVTGGLGKEFCKQFIKEDVNLFITGKNKEKLDLIKTKYNVLGLEFDFNCDLQDFVEYVNLNFGEIDILINCAGIYNEQSIEEVSYKTLDEMINVNVRAPFILIKEFSKQMEKNNWGRIVNIGSNSSYVGVENKSIYCLTKHAILGLSRSVQQELKNYNIRTFCFSPGGLQTNMGKKISITEYPLFIEPKELVEYVINTIKYDNQMIVDEVKVNRTGL